MASTTSTPLSITSSSTIIDTKAATRQSAATSSQMVALPTLPPLSIQSQSRAAKTTAYCRKIARNVMAMATGEAPAEVVATTELPDIVKTIQESWDKVEDKYAVTSLAVAGGIAVLATSGMISAIDRLPLVPGVLELVGIGYTGWFAYKNLVSKTEREILIQKIKDTYKEIIGTS
ncbi:protein CURVATURE THYLAKOID 1B, chloroplastic-like [Olea europaea var. sylvestris]|uniref:protein CURVATURE THYLAKOID 1B, chloroplastic-like n=1 Tax=Olea europaea var. sylvestris TaxID=158386 RepID=UPI000C1CD154|nr:protein CURVATURE THYLAKOID 1B, chloroplastic-like [Olea europaea var. sylvestris]